MSKRKQPTTRAAFIAVDDGYDVHCGDCGTDTVQIGEFYMVHDALWAQAQDAGRACPILCIGCIEARLGRRLRGPDFNAAPLNFFAACGRSPRLRSRLRLWGKSLTDDEWREVKGFVDVVLGDR